MQQVFVGIAPGYSINIAHVVAFEISGDGGSLTLYLSAPGRDGSTVTVSDPVLLLSVGKALGIQIP